MAETQRASVKKPSKNLQPSSTRPQRTGQALRTYSQSERIMHLQRTIGNQAVQGLFASGAIQAKLKIGQPNDVYEQEADRVAEQVMSMSEPEVRQKPT
jgi:hypothetical protein